MCVFLCFILSFFLIVCLSVAFKWLAVKTTSKMTYTVSGGALNSAQSNPFHVELVCLVSFQAIPLQLMVGWRSFCQLLSKCYAHFAVVHQSQSGSHVFHGDVMYTIYFLRLPEPDQNMPYLSHYHQPVPNSTKFCGNIEIPRKWANSATWLIILCSTENCGP